VLKIFLKVVDLFVKEYHSRSVVVLTPSLGFAPQHIAGNRPTYKMRNISERSKPIFSKLSGFLAIAICGSYAKKIRKSYVPIFEGGVGKFFNPHISPNFGDRELKIYKPLDFHRLHLVCEFCDLSLKTGRGKTIVEI